MTDLPTDLAGIGPHSGHDPGAGAHADGVDLLAARGVLVHFSRTGTIAVATAINITVLLAVVLGGVRVLPWPGVATATLALDASLIAEVVYLTSRAHATRRAAAWT